jgi:hypothetical protein
LTAALAALWATPAAAQDSSARSAPLEIRISGANGVHDFLVRSPDDRRGAAALLTQLTATVGASLASEASGPILPRYHIGIGRLNFNSMIVPWQAASETRFTYYPGRPGHDFLLVAFARADVQEERWIPPAPEVTAMLARHVDGLSPIGGPASDYSSTVPGWTATAGIGLLGALAVLLLESRRRRWGLGNGSAGKRGHETGAP